MDNQRGRGSEQGGALETTAINVSDGNNMSRGREDIEARMDPRDIFRIKWTEIIGGDHHPFPLVASSSGPRTCPDGVQHHRA